ncbi:MAG TPA: cupin domain-containing protein [Deltaproteobacteria bacterium]|nr:cupin domain-containing protein [Deltaproteobacteria bacterium]
MGFWNLSALELEEFRPGIMSRAEFGENLTMVCMEIGPGREDTGHEHPFDQCGLVLAGEIEMFIGNERKTLKPDGTYFIPAGVPHGWKTSDKPVRLLDVSATG